MNKMTQTEIKNLFSTVALHMEDPGLLNNATGSAIEATILDVIVHENVKDSWACGLYGQKRGEKYRPIVDIAYKGTAERIQVKEAVAEAEYNLGPFESISPGYSGSGEPTMSLEADGGRFFCAFVCKEHHALLQLQMYIAVGKALSLIYPEDEVLKTSYGRIFWTEVEDAPGLSIVERDIETLFEKGEPGQIAQWHGWLDRLRSTKMSKKPFIIE